MKIYLHTTDSPTKVVGMAKLKTLTINEAVGREVQLWLKRGNLTQMDAANLLNLTQGTISAKLRGRSPFSLQELLSLAGVLDISLSDLLSDGILNAKIPATTELSNDGDKKVAPIGFIPTGATYQVVTNTEPVLAGVGPAGLEPATKGLQGPIHSRVLQTILLLKKLYIATAFKNEEAQ